MIQAVRKGAESTVGVGKSGAPPSGWSGRAHLKEKQLFTTQTSRVAGWGGPGVRDNAEAKAWKRQGRNTRHLNWLEAGRARFIE